MRKLLILVALLVCASSARANEAWRGWCELGNQSMVTSGINSTTKAQQSFPQCTVAVFNHGGSLATIYADNSNTPLANPFQAQLNGQWIFYAANGRYDVQTSGTGFIATTYLDVLLCDPFAAGSTCNNGSGTTQPHNLLSTTHLDTIPVSPPTRGDLITAQNQTSPTGVTPSWARLALGTNGQILCSNAVDDLWCNLIAGTNISITNSPPNITINATGGGTGCTLPGNNTGVLSEHPAGTCYDSLDWTWDDTNFNNLLGNGSNNIHSTGTFQFVVGYNNSNTDATEMWTWGIANSLTGDSNTLGAGFQDNFVMGLQNNLTATSASTTVSGIYMLGRSTNITATTGSNISDVMCLQRACNTVSSFTATGGGNIDDSFLDGENSYLAATGSGSSTSSVFSIGEGNHATSATGAHVSDMFMLGETLTATTSAASTVAAFGINAGFTNSLTDSAAHSLQNTYMLGDNISITASSTNMSEVMGLGSTLTLSNCSHCYLFGENGTGVTSTIGIGFNATPDLQVTSGKVVVVGHLNQGVTKNFAGTCAMSSGTTCTFALTAAYSGTPICVAAVTTAVFTGGNSACTVSSTTVTITAQNSNSLTWGAILIGNPN